MREWYAYLLRSPIAKNNAAIVEKGIDGYISNFIDISMLFV